NLRPCFHQVRFASNSLMAVSALFLTLATAASIPSVVLLRRLRIRRAKSLVEIATRFRGGFGRYGLTMAVLHSTRPSHQTNFSSPTALNEDESAYLSAFFPETRHVRCNQGCPIWAKSRHRQAYSITSSARASRAGGTVRPPGGRERAIKSWGARSPLLDQSQHGHATLRRL